MLKAASNYIESATMGAVVSYRTKQLIGVGGFAEVWRAERVDADGRPCGEDIALKVGRCHWDDDKSQREWQMLTFSALGLEGFVSVLDICCYHNRLTVALELAHDSLLGMSQKGLSVAESARYIGEAAAALDALHGRDLLGRRLVHGGINPTDILICNGHAKVADLGPYPSGAPTSIPFYKAVCMAPEFRLQPVPEPVPESDQYALAASYVWVRLGEAAFAVPHTGILVGALCTSRLPEAERRVLLRALSDVPRDRFPSCRAFVQALQEAL
jgi:serine/threonine protein kinase